MRLKALTNNSLVILHAEDLTIEERHVRMFRETGPDEDGDAESLDFTFLSGASVEGHLCLVADAKLAAGDVLRISIWFRGFHKDLGDSGFFYGSRKVDGRLYEGLWTDLEPAGARTVFPCIDQPEFKATFKVSDDASPRAILKRKRKEWFSCNEIGNFAI